MRTKPIPQTKIIHLLCRSLSLTTVMIAGLMMGPSSTTAATFSEPQTVFYGKVIGTGSAQDFLITEGDVSWTILRSDGVEVNLETSLYEWNDGQFSYRLDVPHSVLALGLSTGDGLPMPPTPSLNIHASILVDGEPAVLLGPAGSVFTTEQLTRTASYRLDLAIGRVALDTDGDGIADWWEDLHGLDKQDPSDAASDLSGDGLSALDAYIRGLDPLQDNRIPALLTREILVYPSGSTAILLDTADVDSTADQIVYTLTALPSGGVLTLRHVHENTSSPDQELTVGATFTQADLLKGRLVYDQADVSAHPGTLKVTVGDETTGHTSAESEVALLAFTIPPALPDDPSLTEVQRVNNFYYASEGWVIMDASHLPAGPAIANPSAGLTSIGLADYLNTYGDDRPYVLISGAGESLVVQGGQKDDVLVAGEGSGSLTGGQGSDRFVFQHMETGDMTITDFSVAEDDVIDLSSLQVSSNDFVNGYIRLVPKDGVYRLELDTAGTGNAYSDLTVALPGLPAASADLYALVESGRVDVGALKLKPRVTLAATNPQASENGPSAGTFTLYRQGSLDGDVTVNLVWSGVAQNGIDYELLPSTVMLPAGSTEVDLPVVPYKDGIIEQAETVSVMATAGSGYLVGPSGQATLTIEDLLMLVTIEALEPTAIVDPLTPGLFVLSRTDVIDRSVLIRLSVSGSATAGTDYQTIPTYVQMAAYQTDALITVTPKPGAVLDGGVETVRIAVQPQSSYRTSGASSARVILIGREDTFADWRMREFPESLEESADVFAASATDSSPISFMERYAFGLDPHSPDVSGLPRPMIVDGRLVVSFRKPLHVTDIRYRVIGAETVENLSQAPMDMTARSTFENDAEPDRVYYEIHQSAQDAPSAFSLIEVEWLP